MDYNPSCTSSFIYYKYMKIHFNTRQVECPNWDRENLPRDLMFPYRIFQTKICIYTRYEGTDTQWYYHFNCESIEKWMTSHMDYNSSCTSSFIYYKYMKIHFNTRQVECPNWDRENLPRDLMFPYKIFQSKICIFTRYEGTDTQWYYHFNCESIDKVDKLIKEFDFEDWVC
ncbi:hypothetical protein CONCODRAFT_7051 [Conidiobolus coronatus NRRL 28638]|uniref:Uncharacterized protein n=1 Tax=Conidiobolus coronatus (strain ATCC 28846 / CBS 209.66 / NRRL 28638) TaxID=796925 RepID=A0A137P5S8_CONC2|nr:hypothetical protein CONCODRAFT_7051 [Conidiobolus coronatus NRRL 28638]|eukprot:KXN70362.1 hypothetical protein CONCODRAFT_7051 [Conidiobolus coronatus NRRL 28638]